ELDKLWEQLAGDDAGKAAAAIWGLAAVPRQAVPHFKKHLMPVRVIDPQALTQRINELESSRFATRQQAIKELEHWGEAALAALSKALEKKPPLETRQRLEQLLQRQTDPKGEALRMLRALEALEHCASPEAVGLLQELALGLPEARRTREAQAACARL